MARLVVRHATAAMTTDPASAMCIAARHVALITTAMPIAAPTMGRRTTWRIAVLAARRTTRPIAALAARRTTRPIVDQVDRPITWPIADPVVPRDLIFAARRRVVPIAIGPPSLADDRDSAAHAHRKAGLVAANWNRASPGSKSGWKT